MNNLRQRLSSKNSQTRCQAVRDIGELLPFAKGIDDFDCAIELLSLALDDSCPEVCYEAVCSLFYGCNESPFSQRTIRALPKLLELLRKIAPDEYSSLGLQIESFPTRIAPMIEALSNADDDPVRKYATIALSRHGSVALLELIAKARSNPQQIDKYSDALAGFGSSAIHSILALFDSSNRQLWRLATKALSCIPYHPSMWQAMVKLLVLVREPDQHCRNLARDMLHRLAAYPSVPISHLGSEVARLHTLLQDNASQFQRDEDITAFIADHVRIAPAASWWQDTSQKISNCIGSLDKIRDILVLLPMICGVFVLAIVALPLLLVILPLLLISLPFIALWKFFSRRKQSYEVRALKKLGDIYYEHKRDLEKAQYYFQKAHREDPADDEAAKKAKQIAALRTTDTYSSTTSSRDLVRDRSQIREQAEEEQRADERYIAAALVRGGRAKPLEPEKLERLPPIAGKPEKQIEEEITYETTGRREPVLDIPAFEKALSDDAGTPGPIEHLVAQSLWLMRSAQATLGLKFILIANTIDIFLDMTIGYIQGIYQTWRHYRTIKKRWQHRKPTEQLQTIIADLNQSRSQLARVLRFPGSKDTQPSFALYQVLATRQQLDQMKRDLALFNTRQILTTAKKSAWNLLLSFIPNPLTWLAPWKDLFIIALVMRYPRAEIERMYTEMVVEYFYLIKFAKNQDLQDNSWHLSEHELALYTCRDHGEDLDSCIEKCQNKIQRLLQMLSNPGQFIYPCHWHRCDLLREVKKRERAAQPNAHFTIEWHRWLTREVARTLRRKGMRADSKERQKRQMEAQQGHQCRRLQKRLDGMFL